MYLLFYGFKYSNCVFSYLEWSSLFRVRFHLNSFFNWDDINIVALQNSFSFSFFFFLAWTHYHHLEVRQAKHIKLRSKKQCPYICNSSLMMTNWWGQEATKPSVSISMSMFVGIKVTVQKASFNSKLFGIKVLALFGGKGLLGTTKVTILLFPFKNDVMCKLEHEMAA